MSTEAMTLRFARGGALVNPPGRGGTPPPPPPVTARFAGDPGSGKVLTGTEEGADGRDYLKTQTGKRMLITHHYYTLNIGSSGNFWNRSDIVSDHDNGYVAMPTFKLGADGWAQSNAAAILAGNYDNVFVTEALWAKSLGYPIFSSFYHEMEDNWNSGTSTTDATAANYRAIYRRIAQIFKDQGATNVTWMPIYQTPWSFTSGAENKWGPWFKFFPDWKGTKSGSNGRTTSADFYTGSQKVISILGVDCYNPNIGGDTYHEWATPMDTAYSKIAADGGPRLPYLVGEWGTGLGKATGTTLKNMPADGWTGFYKRAFQHMRDNDGIGFCIYTVGGNSFKTGGDAANRLAGLKAAVASESSYLVSERPWS